MAEQHAKVFEEIGKDHQLKHVETQDKAAPKIESDVHIKKVDREGFLKEIEGQHDLKHADTVDKSTPKIEDVHVKKVDRQGFLSEVVKAAEDKQKN